MSGQRASGLSPLTPSNKAQIRPRGGIDIKKKSAPSLSLNTNTQTNKYAPLRLRYDSVGKIIIIIIIIYRPSILAPDSNLMLLLLLKLWCTGLCWASCFEGRIQSSSLIDDYELWEIIKLHIISQFELLVHCIQLRFPSMVAKAM